MYLDLALVLTCFGLMMLNIKFDNDNANQIRKWCSLAFITSGIYFFIRTIFGR